MDAKEVGTWFDGSRPKAARLSTTLFLFIFVLHALLGSASLLGFFNSAGDENPRYDAIFMNFSISICALAAALFLAARTDKSMHFAGLLGLGALVAPYLVAMVCVGVERAAHNYPPDYMLEGGDAAYLNRPYFFAMVQMYHLSFLVGGALLAAYAGRKDFTHPLATDTFFRLVVEGLRLLVRKDGTALIRLIGGLAIIGLGIGVAVALTSANLLNRGTGRAVVGIIVLGAAFAASALSFFPEDGPYRTW